MLGARPLGPLSLSSWPPPLAAYDPGRLEQLQLEARKGSVVNVNPTNTRPHSDTPEIRKYKKRFNSEILCAALWGESRMVERGEGGSRGRTLTFSFLRPPAGSTGVNLLVGTENGLMLLDRSGQGKVYSLINRRRFQQMDVLEGLNLLTTISGKEPPGARGGIPSKRPSASPFPAWQ